MNKREGQYRRIGDYVIRLLLAWLAAMPVCVCFTGLMYDTAISDTLMFVLPVTFTFAVIVGAALYNGRTFLVFSAAAMIAAGLCLAMFFESAVRYAQGFLQWAGGHLLYIGMPYNAEYTPVAQGFFLLLLTALFVILLVKLRLPGLVCIAGTAAFCVFYYYTCLTDYTNYNTFWVLVCLPIFFASCIMCFAVKRGIGHKGVNCLKAVPAAALALALALACVPVFEPLARNIEVQDRFYEFVNRISGQSGELEIFNDFSVPSSGFASSESKRFGGPLALSYDRRFTLESQEPLLLRGAVYETYDGRTWSRESGKKFLLEERAFSPKWDNRSELYNNLYSLNERYIADRIRENRVRSYTVSNSVEWASTVYTNANTLRIGFGQGEKILGVNSGTAYADRVILLKDRYTVSYVDTAYSAESLEGYITFAYGSSETQDRPQLQAFAACLDTSAASERVKELAGTLTSNAGSDYDAAVSICSFLNRNYQYSLTPEMPAEGSDFVEDFLFRQRSGYCVYFASAMTVLCRCAGLPARYVEGYRADKTGVNEILASNAHAWTEVYIGNVGWVAFDAVAASDFASSSIPVQDEQTDELVTVSPSPSATVGNESEVTAGATDGQATPEPDGHTSPVTQGAVGAVTTEPERTQQGALQKGQNKTALYVSLTVALIAFAAVACILLGSLSKKKKEKELRRLQNGMSASDTLMLYQAICRDAERLGLHNEVQPTVREKITEMYPLAQRCMQACDIPAFGCFEASARAVEKAAYNDESPTGEETDCLLSIYRLFSAAADKRRGKPASWLLHLFRGL